MQSNCHPTLLSRVAVVFKRSEEVSKKTNFFNLFWKGKKMAKKQEKKQDVRSLDEVVAFCRHHNFHAEIVGAWVWVSFGEKPDVPTRQILREFGFRWSHRRKKWAHNCGTPSRASKKGNPWEKYNVQVVGAVA